MQISLSTHLHWSTASILTLTTILRYSRVFGTSRITSPILLYPSNVLMPSMNLILCLLLALVLSMVPSRQPFSKLLPPNTWPRYHRRKKVPYQSVSDIFPITCLCVDIDFRLFSDSYKAEKFPLRHKKIFAVVITFFFFWILLQILSGWQM